MTPNEVRDMVAEVCGSAVIQLEGVAGGDVSRSVRAELADGRRVFAKTHHDPPANFYDTEAAGLRWLAETNTVRVPEVIAVSDGNPAYLVLEWIDAASTPPADDDDFGRDLAAMHQVGAPSFGRDDARTTGSLALPNAPCSSWAEFYADRRLLPLARIANDRRALSAELTGALEDLARRLAGLAPDESPARLHGDLWAGNRLVDSQGRSWLIDPACHGGHREYDLAMMRLFGGFSDRLFTAYMEASPLAPGWEGRISLHQLAPLVVHAIKFGGAYVPAVASALAEYR